MKMSFMPLQVKSAWLSNIYMYYNVYRMYNCKHLQPIDLYIYTGGNDLKVIKKNNNTAT